MGCSIIIQIVGGILATGSVVANGIFPKLTIKLCIIPKNQSDAVNADMLNDVACSFIEHMYHAGIQINHTKTNRNVVAFEVCDKNLYNNKII